MKEILMSLLVCAMLFVFTSLAVAQDKQPTPQQTVTAVVTQVSQASASAIAILNQVPDLVAQIEKLQAQIKELNAEIDKMKKEQKK
jgi:TolA-binding protein